MEQLTEQDLQHLQSVIRDAAVTGATLAQRGHSPDEVRTLYDRAGPLIVAMATSADPADLVEGRIGFVPSHGAAG